LWVGAKLAVPTYQGRVNYVGTTLVVQACPTGIPCNFRPTSRSGGMSGTAARK